jgi:hypothetical protein
MSLSAQLLFIASPHPDYPVSLPLPTCSAISLAHFPLGELLQAFISVGGVHQWRDFVFLQNIPGLSKSRFFSERSIFLSAV